MRPVKHILHIKSNLRKFKDVIHINKTQW